MIKNYKIPDAPGKRGSTGYGTIEVIRHSLRHVWSGSSNTFREGESGKTAEGTPNARVPCCRNCASAKAARPGGVTYGSFQPMGSASESRKVIEPSGTAISHKISGGRSKRGVPSRCTMYSKKQSSGVVAVCTIGLPFSFHRPPQIRAPIPSRMVSRWLSIWMRYSVNGIS